MKLFPIKNKQRKKSWLCINESRGIGYKSVKENLTKHSVQCQKCSESKCSDHFIQIYFKYDRVKADNTDSSGNT